MRSFLGWLLLLAALAVPAVFFYNWWMKMQAPAAPEQGVVIIKKGEGAFGKVKSGGPSNPIASQPASAAETKPAGAAPGVESSTSAAAGSAPGGVSTEKTMVSTPVTPLRGNDNVATPSPAPKRRKAKSLTVEYAPETNRDPTLSILDHKILALRRQARLDAMRPKIKLKPKKVKRKPKPKIKRIPIWKQIIVQGIISTPNGRVAIVNDELRNKGDVVLNAEIKKITSSSVIFKYKGRTFYKRVE